MKCPKCNSEMFINEWEGWIWECPICGLQGRYATDKECETEPNETGGDQ